MTVYRKTGHPSKNFFLHLQSCRRPDIELSKFYRRSLSRSHYNRPNRSLPSALNNTFIRNRSIFSRYLRTPRCARFSGRRSHINILHRLQLSKNFLCSQGLPKWKHYCLSRKLSCSLWSDDQPAASRSSTSMMILKNKQLPNCYLPLNPFTTKFTWDLYS